MSIIKNTVQVWAPNEQVTAAKLNDVIAQAVFDTGAVAAGGEIVVNSLGELEIPDGSLNAGKLANNAVETNKINAGAVTNAKIADAAVTPAKLSTGRPFWNTDGKVGIGTNSPIVELDVQGNVVIKGLTDTTYLSFFTAFTTAYISYAELSGGLQIWNAQNSFVRIATNNSERMRITNSGDVGIGTSNPAAKLHVNGSIITSFGGLIKTHGGIESGDAATPHYSFTLDEDTGMFRAGQNALGFSTEGVERIRITPSGEVGIGTSNPNAAAMLDVVSTTKGFLPPRMTQTQSNAISSPPAGLILYNSTTNKLQVRTNTAWVDLH